MINKSPEKFVTGRLDVLTRRESGSRIVTVTTVEQNCSLQSANIFVFRLPLADQHNACERLFSGFMQFYKCR